MRNQKYFHVMCDGKTLRILRKDVYLRLIRDERLNLGWIDEEALFLRKPLINKTTLFPILKLGGWLP